MAPPRRAALAQNTKDSRAEPPNPASTNLPEPDDRTAELRIKVWEERPLSPFTYTQLHWGSTAIGARLLVHRDQPTATRKHLFRFQSPQSNKSNHRPLTHAASPAIQHAKTNSPEHFEQAKKWLTLYCNNHKLYQGPGNSIPNPPAHILQITASDNWQPGSAPAILKLVNTSDIDADSLRKYLAFSHY